MSSVDDHEIEHLSSMTDWWDPEGNIKLLHRLNKLRTEFIASTLVPGKEINSTILSGVKILDVGCGGGLLVESLARIGTDVTGVDPSSVLIDMAKEHSRLDERLSANRPTYYATTIEEHATKFPDYYDAVVASEVIEHVSNPTVFLEACVDTLRPGGRIFITTPNKTWLSNLFVILFSENVTGILPKGLHSYDKFMTPNQVTGILERKNCRVDDIHGLTYVPFINQWIWFYFHSFWYAMVATKETKKNK